VLHAENIEVGMELAPLLSRASPLFAVGDAGKAGGRTGVDFDLHAKGLELDQIRRNVSGSGTLALDGVFAESGNWIGQLLQLVGAGSRIEVAQAKVPFTVKRGQVDTDQVDIVASVLNLRMGGRVGFDGTIDYELKLKPRSGGGAFERYATLLDKDGYLPLRLEGDLFSPSLKLPDVKDVLKGGLGGLLDKLKGKADDTPKSDGSGTTPPKDDGSGTTPPKDDEDPEGPDDADPKKGGKKKRKKKDKDGEAGGG